MSTTPNTNETIQQRCERILQAQAERQRAREEEIARQEAEFAAEMERIEAEEKAAREAEEKRIAKEKRIEEEKKREGERKVAEEKRLAEEKKVVEEQQKQQEKMAEKQRQEERRRAEEATAEAEDERVRSTAYARLVEENRAERERAVKELEKRQKHIPPAKMHPVNVVIPPRSSGSKKKTFKSKSVISDKSSDEEKELPPAPRGEKRKRVKLDDEDYEGPAARVGERRFEGPGIAEQLAAIIGQNKDLIDIARRSLDLQERMLYLMVRRERREIARREAEKSEDEDEDEDGEGEEDEEEKEKSDEEKKRKEVREGKKRAD
ncbi:hypothetical protein GGU11DRAFT_822513 [Lentinula aff. detonsa]|nr:hypothetical protein GGU11DRAFT_822513 [Lentinula aff. detonsa]